MLFPLLYGWPAKGNTSYGQAEGSGAETFMHGCHPSCAAVEELSIVAADGEGGRSSNRGDGTNVRGRWSDFYALTLLLHAY